ncbi:hypothetical protein ACFXB3_07190 [Streptomyces sp. NPDC059447]|uniref:hypothetical protein n=1 Tax=Streptomyces sp. NPDC059447 TaxID=3346834 RepID=UPI0036D083E2
MTAEPPLWRDGWDVEPDTAAPPPDRRGHGNPYANADDKPDAYRNVHTVEIKGDLL